MGLPRWREPRSEGGGKSMGGGRGWTVGFPRWGVSRSKGGRKSTGDRRREGGQWDYQGGGNPGVKVVGSQWEEEEGGQWDSQGGEYPGVKGVGSQREAGEERVGSGIPKRG